LADGCAQAAPQLAEALGAALRAPRELDHASAAPVLVAMELWDDAAWLTLASRQVDIARDTGALARLPAALDLLGRYHAEGGRLSLADELLAEAAAVRTAPGKFPALPLLVAALRGEPDAATSLHGQLAGAGIDGAVMAAADRALAVLHNGLGQHGRALAPALRAVQADRIATSSWALGELVEAATRCSRHDLAREAVEDLAARTGSSDTAWARGAVAHARALVADVDAAEALHREALDALGRCAMTVHLARAHLTYGEWLRRHDRDEDARRELRRAHELFDGMAAAGFAARARRELLATGERVRVRSEEGHGTLTRQEEHIARLAREGRTNTEIGAQLFLSPRTVEWHLRKVFVKLGVRSRRELADVLPDRP
jgi:DNA-binding CsgD family transcriptional regulator